MLNTLQGNAINNCRSYTGKFLNILGVMLLVLGISFSKPVEAPIKPLGSFKQLSYTQVVKQRDCLTEALFAEAAGEPLEGKKAVLSVIHNRVQAKGFPGTYCKVVQAPKAFSYRNNLNKGEKALVKVKNPIDTKAYHQVQSLANEAALGNFKPTLEPSVLYYSQTHVNQRWMRTMRVAKIIGRHKFLSSEV